MKCHLYCSALYYLTICLENLSISRHPDLLHLFKGCLGFQCMLISIYLPGPEQRQIFSMPDLKANAFFLLQHNAWKTSVHSLNLTNEVFKPK